MLIGVDLMSNAAAIHAFEELYKRLFLNNGQ
jgi:hypothetical protein